MADISGSKMTLRVPRLQKLSHHIAEVIKDRILVGDFPENSTLPSIRELAHQLGVSHGSLREALRILEDDGFLVMKTGPGGGPVVRHPGDERVTKIVAEILQLKKTKLRDLHEARYYIEPPCARNAARARTEQDLKRLEASLVATTGEGMDNAEFLRHTVEFHRIIADTSQNRILRLFFGCLRDLVYAASLRIEFDAAARLAATEEHQRIYDAIRDRNEGGAEECMRRHLERFEPALSEWFEQYMEKLL